MGNWDWIAAVVGILVVISLFQRLIRVGANIVQELDRSNALLFGLSTAVYRHFDDAPVNLTSIDDINSKLIEINDNQERLAQIDDTLREILDILKEYSSSTSVELASIGQDIRNLTDQMEALCRSLSPASFDEDD